MNSLTKSASIKQLKMLISRSFGLVAVALLMMALIAPDFVEHLPNHHYYSQSPLGIVSSVEQLVHGIFS